MSILKTVTIDIPDAVCTNCGSSDELHYNFFVFANRSGVFDDEAPHWCNACFSEYPLMDRGEFKEAVQEIAEIFESGAYATRHNRGGFCSDRERWDSAATELGYDSTEAEGTFKEYRRMSRTQEAW
mgnify:CR=1 FL=1